MFTMPDWDLDAGIEADDALSLPGALRRVLRILHADLPQLAPENGGGDRDHPRLNPEFQTAIEQTLGQRAASLIESSEEIHRLVDVWNNATDPSDRADAAPRRRTGSSPSIMAARMFAGRKIIHLGFVDRYLVYPASPPLSDLLLKLLAKIPGIDDLLISENHDVFGWHYHYCDRDKRRSDTIMSFDRRRMTASWTTATVPLCWEPHAINKAKFKAKPWKWGDTKRSSIYTACARDLAVRPPLFFKPPSKEAKDVWP